MQAAADGLLDVDAPVRDNLGVRIARGAFAHTFTSRQFMARTSGLDGVRRTLSSFSIAWHGERREYRNEILLRFDQPRDEPVFAGADQPRQLSRGRALSSIDGRRSALAR